MKALVLGSPGAGKSVFSKKLAKKLGIPLYHLDMLFWNADKSHLDREEFIARQLEAMQGDSWIIDGTYHSTADLRLDRCDTVFLFQLPVDVCIEGVVSRSGKPRDDLPWQEAAVPDPDFLDYIRNYHSKGSLELEELISRHPELTVLRFFSREDADEYINSL